MRVDNRLIPIVFVVAGLAAIAARSEDRASGSAGTAGVASTASADLRGTLKVFGDDGLFLVCPLHEASFEGTAGVDASVTTCYPDGIFRNSFE